MKKIILGLAALVAAGCQTKTVDVKCPEPPVRTVETLAMEYAVDIAQQKFDTSWISCGPTVSLKSLEDNLVLIENDKYTRTQLICQHSETGDYNYINVLLEFEKGAKGWYLHDLLGSTHFVIGENEDLGDVVGQIADQTRRLLSFERNPVNAKETFQEKLKQHIDDTDWNILYDTYFKEFTEATRSCFNPSFADGLIYTRNKENMFRYARYCSARDAEKWKGLVYIGEGQEFDGAMYTTHLTTWELKGGIELQEEDKSYIVQNQQNAEKILKILDFKRNPPKTKNIGGSK